MTVDRAPRARAQDPALAPMATPSAPTVTRRRFLAEIAVLGISAPALGSVLAACGTAGGTRSGTPGRSSAATAGTTFGGTPPVIQPPPTTATYGEMLEVSALVPMTPPSPTLGRLLGEVAAESGIPIAPAVAVGRRQARLTVTSDDPSLGPQAYRLEVVVAGDGPLVMVRAGAEPGAYYGLRSLAQLFITDGSTRWLRAAAIDDAPGFERRGAILDPAPLTGVSTEASRAALLERVRLGVRHKLDFVDLPDRTPWPELVRYCDEHHVELMVAKGYQDHLTTTPRQDVKAQLAEQLDAGVRSIALCWDDIATTDPEVLARHHAAVFLDLYDFIRGREPGTVVSAVLPPYGGIPGQRLVGSAPGDGERYLALMRDALPADVRVFWTGDGGVFSERVTSAGARAYAGAVGHELGLWDNDAIRFSAARRPCSGRAPDLSSVVRSYMGNLAGEAHWEGTNGEFALLTSLFYAWSPAAYEPAAAAAAVERILATRS